MMVLRFLLLILLVQCTTGASPEPEPETPPAPFAFTPGPKKINILYVGNSLTYFNDLPALVSELAAMDQKQVTFKVIAPGGYSLEDHWNIGDVQKEIAKGGYDIVIGQQGPSALPESQVLLKEYAGRFAGEAAKHQASWALYMVWPSEQRSFDLDNVIYSYTQAANSTSALLFPAGLAWKIAWQADPAFPLYGPDRFHPSIHGSLLAAMTIYATLYEKENFDFINVAGSSWKNEVTSQQLVLLKSSALRAVRGS
jgi:hypothetical protein